MGRERLTVALVALYTIGVVLITVIWERRDRLDCHPRDESCNDLNASHAPIFGALGFLAWIVGTLVIVWLVRRFTKPF